MSQSGLDSLSGEQDCLQVEFVTNQLHLEGSVAGHAVVQVGYAPLQVLHHIPSASNQPSQSQPGNQARGDGQLGRWAGKHDSLSH